ncbi:hypothetical protein PRECH8_03120 [Insulibacter thermoxylanivorax]|uniref:Uncharacterized protein n=1 Tax=Insulibacter thermoxylanivorax TaxID=2749268 RepID=A0A916QA61_9BACL|nr:hypothetical protein [Insulibacter thermoxylanivorax]GFR37016.1 hypothetical protein PRECH8_03120 [Insulibacter thermoxylanivorax]
MISIRELKEEIELLTAQNRTMSDEIKELRRLLRDQARSHRSQGGQSYPAMNNHRQQDQQGNQDQWNQNGHYGQGEPHNQQREQGNQQGDQHQQRNQNGNQNQQGQQSNLNLQPSNQQGHGQIANIANEFLQLKGLTSQLETKVINYISSQTGGNQLRQEDVAYLILNMMNGMIDWTIEYVSRQQGGQNG